MSKSVWEIKLTGDLDGKVTNLTGKVAEFEKSVASADGKLLDFSSRILRFNQASTAIQNLLAPINNLSEGYVRLDANMKQVQMMTKASDTVMEELLGKANKAAAVFGGDPADSMEGFLELMNKFGVEVVNDVNAFARIDASAYKLSKTMRGDVVGAFQAATTMANQYGVDMSDTAKAAAYVDDMLSKMAKSALVGSEDIPKVSAAIGVVGNSSKEAGVKLSETLAMLQALGKFANKSGAEGGTIARNIFERLQKGRFTEPEVLAELSDKKINIDVNMLADNTVPLIDKLKEIKKLSQDPALMGKMFDSYNVAPLKSLLSNLDEYEKMQAQIAGATLQDLDDMADTVMQGVGEKINRFKTQLQILKNDFVAPFADVLPFLSGTLTGLEGIVMMAPGLVALTEITSMLGLANKWTALMTWWANFSFVGWMKSVAAGAIEMGRFLLLLAGAGLEALGGWIIGLVSTTAAQLGLNVAMAANPIGAFIVGIAALIAAIVGLIYYWDEIIEGVKNFGRELVNLIDGAIPGFKNFAKGVLKWIMAPFKWVWKIIDDLKNSFGALFGGKNKLDIDTSVTANADELVNSNKTTPFFSEKLIRKGKGAGGSGEGSGSSDRSRFTNVTINIAKLFDNININTSKINQSYAQVEDELLRVITNATNNLNNIDFAGKA